MNDTNEIESIWDGWERQAFGRRFDGNGASCALGYLQDSEDVYFISDPVKRAAMLRVAGHIAATFPQVCDLANICSSAEGVRGGEIAIAVANNVFRLTPDQFRQIDIDLQIEAVSKPLIESVEIAVGGSV